MFPLDDDPLHFQLSADHHQNPTLKHHNDDDHYFSTFPSPFFDDHDLPLNQIFLMSNNNSNHSASSSDHIHLYHITPTNNSDAGTKKEPPSELKGQADDDQTGVMPSSRRRGLGVVPRRRTGKKDRHSKISTAQGIRDRRMRLSLQVARKFFDLQDMLGYDKASKTIEWLFSKSKKAIKDLIRENNPQGNSIDMSDAKSESFVSECEVVSGIDQESNETPLSSKNCIKEDKKSRKIVSKPNMRESREKARARARCRTREKLMNKGLHKSSPTCDDLQILGYANNPFEGGLDHQAESGSINQERVSPYRAAHDSFGQQMEEDVGTIERLLGTSTCSTSSCPISDYYCSATVSCCIDPDTSFMGFLGHWDLLNNNTTNSVTNQVSLEGNPSTDYSADTTNFPFYQQ